MNTLLQYINKFLFINLDTFYRWQCWWIIDPQKVVLTVDEISGMDYLKQKANDFRFSMLTFFLITSYQILKNYAILINYKSLFQEKDSLQLNHFQFSKINKLLLNSAICLWKFRFGKCFLMVSAIKEFIFKNKKRWSCRKSLL